MQRSYIKKSSKRLSHNPKSHTKLKMYEKELYPAVERFLKLQKNCLSKYVGTELSLKRGKTSLRADVFGISKSNHGERIIYLCEGKKELKRRSFGKVVGEAVELLKYADYVYIFGSTESFETNFFTFVGLRPITSSARAPASPVRA